MFTNWDSLVKELIEKKPPSTLYHYTTQDGVLGIINSGELWATNIRYMNDTTEFFGGLNLAKEHLKDLRLKKPSLQDAIVHFAIQRLENIRSVDICAVSFCENNDLLSQWRGYSGSSGGICLGFRSAKLVSSAASICGRIAPCIYDQRKQHELVDEMLNVSFNDLSSEFRPSQETSRAAAEVFVR